MGFPWRQTVKFNKTPDNNLIYCIRHYIWPKKRPKKTKNDKTQFFSGPVVPYPREMQTNQFILILFVIFPFTIIFNKGIMT